MTDNQKWARENSGGRPPSQEIAFANEVIKRLEKIETALITIVGTLALMVPKGTIGGSEELKDLAVAIAAKLRTSTEEIQQRTD